MQITPINPLDNRSTPVAPRQPLRPSSKGPAIRINLKRSLQLHAVTAVTVALIVLGLGLAVLLRGAAVYETYAILYVSPTFPATLHLDAEHIYPYESYVQEQIQALTNYAVIQDAIHHLPPGIWGHPGEPEQSSVERLQRSIEVSRIGPSYEIGVSLAGSNPAHLAEIVNAVTASYLAKLQSQQFYGRDTRLATLREDLATTQKDLDDRIQEQTDITRALGMASVTGGGANPYDSELSSMRSNLTQARAQRIQAEAQLDSLKNGDPSAPNSALNAAADEIIEGDSGLKAMKEDLAKKKAQLVDQLAGQTPANPQRKQTEQELAQIDLSLSQMQTNLRKQAADRLEKKLRTEVNRASTVEAKLNDTIQHGVGAASTAAPRLQRAQELTAEITRLQARYTDVDSRIHDLELEGSSPAPVHVSSPAMPPLAPIPNKKRAKLPLLFPAAILMGVLAAILMDLLDPHVYNGGDLEAVLGFAPIGMLLNDGDVTQRLFDECVLRLAAGIDHSVRIAGARTFVFTGVNTGAGTTSIIEDLGSALARLGRKTLTIDASGNTAPTAYVTLGNTPGIPAEEKPENGKLQTAPVVMTDLLPISSAAPLSGFVVKAFQDLTREYDVVLVDAAPILISAETEYLARCADVTVMVAEAGKTTRRQLNRTAKLMERLDVAGAAAVINKVRLVRIEDNLKHDLKEFEARLNMTNLRWRPQRPVPGVPPTPASSPFSSPEDVGAAETVAVSSEGK